jgi:hypothetical protein
MESNTVGQALTEDDKAWLRSWRFVPVVRCAADLRAIDLLGLLPLDLERDGKGVEK